MRRLVKICGLRDAEAVDAAVAAGADALGFVFAESVRRLSPGEAASLSERVPRGILRVAVMRHPAAELWREVAAVFRPDVVQTDAADFANLQVGPGVVRWPVIRETEDAEDAELPETYVYEGAASGRGLQVDWQRAARLARKGRMILAGGLDCGNVRKAIAAVAPFGLDVSSGVESAPGVKDRRLIEAFVRAVRSAERDSTGAVA
jgi:phosphoribosylanthranilate isomerase